MSGNIKFRWFLVAPIIIAIFFIATISESVKFPDDYPIPDGEYGESIKRAMELDQLDVNLRLCWADIGWKKNVEGSDKCEEIEKELEAAKIDAITANPYAVNKDRHRQDAQEEVQESLREERKKLEERRKLEGLRLAEKNRQLEEGLKKLEEEKRQLKAFRLAEEKRLLKERKKLEAAEERQRQAQAKKKPTPQSGTGSGFFVSKMGHVITNAHVVQNCKKVTIGDNVNKQVPAELINTDRSNDLALLKLSTLEMASAESKSLIQKLGITVVPLASKGLLRNEDVKLGEKVLVAGYPFGDTFSNTIKVTTGVVSATRGAGDNSGQIQLDAAVQPGNSGGPIYDSGGNIVGVVVAQLNKRTFGSFVENMNFGIKASTVRQFLVASGINSNKSERTEEKSTEQLAEIAQNQALMVMCLQ